MCPKKLKPCTSPTQKSAQKSEEIWEAHESSKKTEFAGLFYDSTIQGSKQQDDMASRIVIDESAIKGYHHFKIRTPYITPMPQLPIDREYTNTKDVNACLVWLPPICRFPSEVHEMVTDEKRKFKLSNIAGLPMGHVSKSLSKLFRDVLDEGGEITGEATGQPKPCFPPWPKPNKEEVEL